MITIKMPKKSVAPIMPGITSAPTMLTTHAMAKASREPTEYMLTTKAMKKACNQ